MPFCPYCSADIVPGLYQCPNCGSPLSPSQTAAQAAVQAAPAPQPIYTQQPMPPAQQSMPAPSMQPYAPAAMPVYADPVVSPAAWVGYLLLCMCLPLIGPLILTSSAKEQSVRNFGKAWLLLYAILVIALVLFGFTLGFLDEVIDLF